MTSTGRTAEQPVPPAPPVHAPPVHVPSAPAVLGSLSPSRAADFKNCPLLYRFRCIDRLPEAPSSAATRGTMVHAVLEALFDLPADERTVEAARALLPQAWQRVQAEEPGVVELFTGDTDGSRFREWMSSAGDLLGNYFTLEDPSRLEPRSRELRVEVDVDGVRLRGYVDRLDESPSGALRVVDYKTGSSPGENYEAAALFQLKFYALVLWRTGGVVPAALKLIYLGDTDTLTYSPDADELERFERIVLAIWTAIRRAVDTGDFQPSPGRICRWCDHQALCPAFGGTPPPYPQSPVLTDPRDDPLSPQVARTQEATALR